MWGAQDPLDAVTLDLQCVGHLAAGADAQEGITSFFEKRAPIFPLKASKDISGFPPELQRIFRAMKTYGLIVADNGSDMYISGTYDTRWNNGVLNPAFGALKASDFEVIALGYQPPAGVSAPTGLRVVN